MNELEEAIEDWKKSDYSHCFTVIRKHAESGDIKAMMILASALSAEHWGLEQNVVSGIDWFKKAQECGHPHAAINIALILDPENPVYEGKIERNKEESEKYYKLAFNRYLEGAESGDPESMYNLSNCYSCGWGTEYNSELGRKWASKAEELGYNADRAMLGKNA